jgi:leucyl aminopeptidase
MKTHALSRDVTKVTADALIVNLFEGVKKPGGATEAVDNALNGAITKLISSGEIKGKQGEVTLIHVFGQIAAARVAVLGLGPRRKASADTIRRAVAGVCRTLRGVRAKRIVTVLHGAGAGGIGAAASAQAITEGAILGLYAYDKQVKKPDRTQEVRELAIVETDRSKLAEARRGIEVGTIVADSVCFARDMCNTPANFMTPTDMAERAKVVAEAVGLNLTVFDRDEMERLKMGALLGVAKGSHEPPKFIVLEHRGDPDHADKVLGLLGKGVTFDSGGISLKPAGGMAEMKTDMSGGAAVISAMRAIGLLNPTINVTALVPCSENLPSSTAQKPGDIVTALNGKTIEVDNTDAEGRLLLADALSYGNTLGLSPMIDVATLTGAILVTLGKVATGAFTNHQPTMDRLLKAASVTGEKIWQLPMYDEYKTQNASDVADVKNTGGRFAGSITAALFLAEFSEKTPWVHLDIAGTARMESTRGYSIKGSSGVPVRTLVQFVMNSARNSR